MIPSKDEAEEFNYLFGRIPLVDDELEFSPPPLAMPMERHVLYASNTTEEAIARLKRSYPDPANPTGQSVTYQADVDPPSSTACGMGEDATDISAFALWQLHAERRKLQQEYLEHWNATASKTGTGRPVDAIISPAAAYPAPPHGYNT